uniref:Uncharacterized protein n=1 Tax=Lepeophtheirus salmonis TaxID=72036 RepID=A0A0K2TRB1_LEPSM
MAFHRMLKNNGVH